jgi:hypothetical protein
LGAKSIDEKKLKNTQKFMSDRIFEIKLPNSHHSVNTIQKIRSALEASHWKEEERSRSVKNVRDSLKAMREQLRKS